MAQVELVPLDKQVTSNYHGQLLVVGQRICWVLSMMFRFNVIEIGTVFIPPLDDLYVSVGDILKGMAECQRREAWVG